MTWRKRCCRVRRSHAPPHLFFDQRCTSVVRRVKWREQDTPARARAAIGLTHFALHPTRDPTPPPTSGRLHVPPPIPQLLCVLGRLSLSLSRSLSLFSSRSLSPSSPPLHFQGVDDELTPALLSRATVTPQPFTPNLQPYTPNPNHIPQILNPTPQIQPCTPDPQPYIPNPQPYTPNPQPFTPNPQQPYTPNSTQYPKFSTMYPMTHTLNSTP